MGLIALEGEKKRYDFQKDRILMIFMDPFNTLLWFKEVGIYMC